MKTTFNTVGEFEEFYAKGSGVTVEWLHEHGQRGGRCDCDFEECTGWGMYRDSCQSCQEELADENNV